MEGHSQKKSSEKYQEVPELQQDDSSRDSEDESKLKSKDCLGECQMAPTLITEGSSKISEDESKSKPQGLSTFGESSSSIIDCGESSRKKTSVELQSTPDSEKNSPISSLTSDFSGSQLGSPTASSKTRESSSSQNQETSSTNTRSSQASSIILARVSSIYDLFNLKSSIKPHAVRSLVPSNINELVADLNHVKTVITSCFFSGNGLNCDKIDRRFYMGCEESAKNISFLQLKSITHVVDLTPRNPDDDDRHKEHFVTNDITYKRFPIRDRDPDELLALFPSIANYIASALDDKHKILVYDRDGTEQSIICVAAYYMSFYNFSAVKAMNHVRRVHHGKPRQNLLKQLIAFETQLIEYEKILQQERARTPLEAESTAKRPRVD